MGPERFNNVDEALTNPEAKRMSDEELDQEYAEIEAEGFRREQAQKAGETALENMTPKAEEEKEREAQNVQAESIEKDA